jgi:quercetin dioxygenase-like cupin family protein
VKTTTASAAAEKPENSEAKDLYAKPGISKGEHLASLALPSGMGTAVPIVASPDRYCGTLTLGPGDAFNFHYHPRQDELVYVIEGTMGAGSIRTARS